MSVTRKTLLVPDPSSERNNESSFPRSEMHPPLVVLLNTHHLNLLLLAKMSGVALSRLRLMLMKQPVPHEDIYAVLTVFNLCYGTHYTIQSTLLPEAS